MLLPDNEAIILLILVLDDSRDAASAISQANSRRDSVSCRANDLVIGGFNFLHIQRLRFNSKL